MEDEFDLSVGPLLDVVAAGIPDRHPPAAVLTTWDVSLEGGVLQRMVLGVHGEMVLFRSLGYALGEGPGDEDAVALESQVPVQASCVMLLDHEELARPTCRRPAAHRFRRLLWIPFCAVGGEGTRPLGRRRLLRGTWFL